MISVKASGRSARRYALGATLMLTVTNVHGIAQEAHEKQARGKQAEEVAEAKEDTSESQRDTSVWDRLADCESGNWVDGGASFEEGSARWYWARPGTEVPPWGTTIHHGGLQFHPGTWDAFKLDGYPARAYDATREQQIAVAEIVLERQGWEAWPVCSRKIGLR